VAIYTVLMVIEIKLMLKAIGKGPDQVLPALQASMNVPADAASKS
jgi:cytochrome bd ubiquinol oxidase subunit I